MSTPGAKKRNEILKNYGVWVARPVWYHPERHGERTPHVELHFKDTSDATFEAAINVGSNQPESQLIYWFKEPLGASAVADFKDLKMGFHALSGQAKGLDYLRDPGLLDFTQGVMLPHDVLGRNNDILDRLLPLLERSIKEKAVIYIFGSRYTDKKGMHNVHMNQGSDPAKYEDTTQRDGAIFFHFEEDDTWAGLFLAFASQRIPTDDDGVPLEDAVTLAKKLGKKLGS